MSGRKQHHFWQMLQRGFAEQRKGDQYCITVYRRDREPFTANTKDFGAERDFFDFRPGVGADEGITRTEGDLQSIVRLLRKGTIPEDTHRSSMGRLINSLENRTKFIRAEFGDYATEVTATVSEWFSKPETLRKMMRNYAMNNPQEIEDIMAPYIQDPAQRSAIREIVAEKMGDIDSGIFEKICRDSRSELDEVIRRIPRLAKESHIKALMGENQADSKIELYNSLHFRFVSGFNNSMILPDTMVSFLANGRLSPFLNKGDRLEAVWFPITPDAMLLGETRPGSHRSQKEILRGLASTAYEAFVAKSNQQNLRKLSGRIGRNARILSQGNRSWLRLAASY